MARNMPELYEIKGDAAKLTKEFLRALAEGLLLTLRNLGVLP